MEMPQYIMLDKLEESKDIAKHYMSEYTKLNERYMEMLFCTIDIGLAQEREDTLLREIANLATQLKEAGIQPKFLFPDEYKYVESVDAAAPKPHEVAINDIISDNQQAFDEMINSGLKEPYITETKTVIETTRKYNPDYGDNRECVCGHAYYRHFDTYEDMEPVGCKYCECGNFQEKSKPSIKTILSYKSGASDATYCINMNCKHWELTDRFGCKQMSYPTKQKCIKCIEFDVNTYKESSDE